MEVDKINITICGDGGAGKSSITLRLVRSEWSNEYDPTIEDWYTISRDHDGKTYFLALTDTAGQEEYRSLQSSYSLQADAFLLVYDITNPTTLHQHLAPFLSTIQQQSEIRESQGKPPAVKIVAGNKCDLDAERKITAEEGLKWARARGCGFMETSAREMVNVEETFALLMRRVIEARRDHEAPPSKKQQQQHKRKRSLILPSRKTFHAPSTSFATTAPLSPVDEKAEQVEETSWWQRLRCW